MIQFLLVRRYRTIASLAIARGKSEYKNLISRNQRHYRLIHPSRQASAMCLSIYKHKKLDAISRGSSQLDILLAVVRDRLRSRISTLVGLGSENDGHHSHLAICRAADCKQRRLASRDNVNHNLISRLSCDWLSHEDAEEEEEEAHLDKNFSVFR